MKSAEEKDGRAEVIYEEKGEEKTITADYVLVSVGRKPNTDKLGLENTGVQLTDRGLVQVDSQCRTNVANLYAIGDIIAGPQLAHKASYEAKVAAEAIAGMPSVIDHVCIPAVVFSEPEIAIVGHTAASAKEAGIDATETKFPFAANGRAIALILDRWFRSISNE